MQAIRKKRELDMLHGSIWDKLPRFALPVAATAMLEQLFNASDVAVVGNFTGEARTAAVAAVGANSPIIGLIVNLFIGIALGTNVVISHAIGEGEFKRCKRTLALSLAEGIAALGVGIFLVLFFGRSLLAIFNSDPEVVETGYIRLMLIMMAHAFSLFYEVISGYLRGFGISLTPALLTMLGVCGIRLAWVQFVFPLHRTFRTIMIAFPVSLAATAGLMLLALLYYRPSRRFAGVQRKKPEEAHK